MSEGENKVLIRRWIEQVIKEAEYKDQEEASHRHGRSGGRPGLLGRREPAPFQKR